MYINGKILEISIVHTDYPCACVKRRLKLMFIMCLDQCRQSQAVCYSYVFLKSCRLRYRAYKQDCRSSKRLSLIYHVLIDREVLSETRNIYIGGYLTQIIIAS